MKKQSKSILLVLLLAFFSASCGSSGNNASGGIGGTGISQGTYDGVGSIKLNGEGFNTTATTAFIIDDNQTGTSQNDLREGMQITVQVDATGITATGVVFEPEVEGPLDSNTATTNTLVVLGRTVVVDDTTKIEDTAGTLNLTQANLNPNDMLEVSGLVLADDKIQATHIMRRDDKPFIPGTTEVELKGTVAVASLTTTTFTIGGQTIDFSAATVFPGLKEGDFVEVKGTRGISGGTLSATEIKKENGVANPGNILEIEGVVSISGTTLFVGGQEFSTSDATTSDATTFEGGAKDDIIANVRLEVEGTINASDVLIASKVKFHGSRIKMEADVTGKGTSPDSLTLLGNPVVINGLTEIKDGLVFSAITTDRLEIRGYLSGGIVTATRVRTGDVGDVTLQAPVEDKSRTNLTLLGNNVTPATNAIFKDLDGTSLSSAAFFAKIQTGSLVKVKGSVVGTEIVATEVEIED